MTEQSRKILDEMQVRKSKKQKAAFRAWLCGELEQAGYAPCVEEGFAARNVVVGDPDKAQVLLTAHYDTQAVLPVPNLITPRNLFFFVLYQALIVLPLFLVVAAAEGLIFAFVPKSAAWWLAPLSCIAICAFFMWWVIDGKANRHTANDNTSGVLTLLETALALPPEHRDRVCFVFFDNEEKGMFGSAAFTKAHRKAKKETLNINFDCVSDGNFIQFFPGRKLKMDEDVLARIEAAFPGNTEKRTEVVRGFGFYPSDNALFQKGVGVCALKRRKIIGYYMDRIHTRRDTVLEEENIELLRRGALALAAGCKEEAVS